jgi:Transcriptional regulators
MDEFELNLNILLVETFNTILEYEDASLKSLIRDPVSVSEAHVIEAVGSKDGEATVSKVAAMLNIAVPTATVAIKKLENRGFMTKTQCSHDGRRAFVGLTQKGRRVDRAHRLFHNRMVKNISGEFSEQEKGILLTAINKLNDFFVAKKEG